MKKLLAGLLSACMVLLEIGSMLVPVAAGQTGMATVKAVYYADASTYPDAEAQLDVATSSEDSVGGKLHWDYGAILVEPNAGYSVTGIYKVEDEAALYEGNAEEYTVSTLNGIKNQFENAPDNFDTLIKDIDGNTKAVFLNGADYQRILYNYSFYVGLSDANGNVSYMRVGFKNHYHWVTVDPIEINEELDMSKLPEIASFLKENSMTMMDFDIDISAAMGYEIAYTTISADQTKVSCSVNGDLMITLTTKKDGRAYELNIPVNRPADASKITFSCDGETMSRDDEGYYRAQIDSSQNELSFTVNLIDGWTIDWDKTKICGYTMKADSEKTYISDDNTTYTLKNTTDQSTANIYIKKNSGFYDGCEIRITNGKVSYVECFFFESTEESDMSIGCPGADSFYLAPYSTHSLFDYITPMKEGLTKAEARAEFLRLCSNGTYSVNFCGASLLKDADGNYTGEFTIYHTGFRYDVVNNNTGVSISGSDTLLICNSRVAVLAGDTVSVKDFIGDSWNGYTVEIKGSGFSYDATTGLVTTPSKISGEYVTGKAIVTGLVNGCDKKVIGTMIIDVCKKAEYDEAVSDIITNELDDGDELIIDADDSQNQDAEDGTLISKDILNSLQDKKDATLEITTTDGDREIVWGFDSGDGDMTEATQDLMVDVDVSDVTVSGEAGVQLEFKDNGVLPTTATMRIDLTEEEAQALGINQAGVTVKLLYYKSGDTYTVEEDSLLVRQNDEGGYYIEVPVAHNSTFVLTTKKSASKITLKAKTAGYTGKAISIGKAKVKGSSGKVTYTYYTDAKCTKKTTTANGAKKAGAAPSKRGTYYVKAKVAADAAYKAATSTVVKLVITTGTTTITLKAQSAGYTGKAVAIGKAKVKGSTGKVTYTYYTNAKCTKKTTTANGAKKAGAAPSKRGTYYVVVKVAADSNYKAATSSAVKYTITKGAPTIKVKTTSKALKQATVKSKAQTFAIGASVTGKGTLSYKKVSGSKALTINKKTGKITLAKGTKAGTYKIKVKISSKASTNYKSASKTVTVTVKVK